MAYEEGVNMNMPVAPAYGGNYHGPYAQGNSYRGSSYRNMKHNSMGRYSRTNGLHDMIDNLPEDKMIQVQRYIEEMGRM